MAEGTWPFVPRYTLCSRVSLAIVVDEEGIFVPQRLQEMAACNSCWKETKAHLLPHDHTHNIRNRISHQYTFVQELQRPGVLGCSYSYNCCLLTEHMVICSQSTCCLHAWGAPRWLANCGLGCHKCSIWVSWLPGSNIARMSRELKQSQLSDHGSSVMVAWPGPGNHYTTTMVTQLASSCCRSEVLSGQ